MSEDFQLNNDRQHQDFDSETFKEDNTQQAAQTVNTTGSSTLRAATPRAGALLVEVYGKLVGKQQNTVSPYKVLFEYSKFLVSFRIATANFLLFRLAVCRFWQSQLTSVRGNRVRLPGTNLSIPSHSPTCIYRRCT
jgi:hypothetical protein